MNKKPTKQTPAPAFCPLCAAERISFYHQDKTRDYLRCGQCGLIFVPPQYHLDADKERARYDLHQNNPDDIEYRRFLSRLAEPLLEKLQPGQSGLDFGCGPGPVLSLMLTEEGFRMELFDPFYRNNQGVLNRHYDFITATEVVEHMAAPGLEFDRLFGMISEGGILGIMTKMVTDPAAFSRWHYIQDETHISFFSRQTFEYLADIHEVSLEFFGNDVIIMTKQ